MHSHVSRRTIRFGGRNLLNTGGLAGDAFCAVPGPREIGGAQASPKANAAALTFMSTFDQTMHKLDALGDDRGGPVRAIAIAPDSPIAECDLWFGTGSDMDRWRLSPGNPWLGCLDGDSCLVTLPNAIPMIKFDPTVNNDVGWDAIVMSNDGDGKDMFSWPLRLEIWRGDVLPLRPRTRASHRGHIIRQHTTTTQTFMAYFCVDGRRRIDVQALPDAADYTLAIKDCTAWKMASDGNHDSFVLTYLPLDSAGNLSALLNNGKTNTFSLNGNPLTIIGVEISKAAGAGTIQIKCAAWDD